jgi:RNA polymerase subunit RPABC4/transcription elongation factor Spt4
MVADFINFLSQASTITIVVGYIFALWLALTIWTWFDVASRTSNIFYRFGAIVLVALGSLLGFVVYLMLRPSQTVEEVQFRYLEEKIFEAQSKAALCNSCGEVVEPEFSFCASCGVKVRKNCGNCERELSYTWNICPYCAHPQKETDKVTITEEVKVEEVLEPGTSPQLAVLSFIKKLRMPIPKVSLKRGGKKRGRPKKEKQEVSIKKPRGRPRKQIAPVSSEA